METSSIIFSLVEVILYVILGAILLMLFFVIIDKIFKYFTLKFSPVLIQKGEMVHKKIFKSKDGYELRMIGEIKKESEFVILGVHDFFGNRLDFSNFNNYVDKNQQKFSFISFDQRGYNENAEDIHKNLGAVLSDVKEIIDYLVERHVNKKIILIGIGTGASVCLNLENYSNVYKVIATSLKTKIYPNKSFVGFAFKNLIGWIFSSKTKFYYDIDGFDLANDKEVAKKFNESFQEKNFISIREYYQEKTLNKRVEKKILKNKIKTKCLILQPKIDIFTNPKKFAKLISSINKENIDFRLLDEERHLLLCENKTEIYENIFSFIKSE